MTESMYKDLGIAMAMITYPTIMRVSEAAFQSDLGVPDFLIKYSNIDLDTICSKDPQMLVDEMKIKIAGLNKVDSTCYFRKWLLCASWANYTSRVRVNLIHKPLHSVKANFTTTV